MYKQINRNYFFNMILFILLEIGKNFEIIFIFSVQKIIAVEFGFTDKIYSIFVFLIMILGFILKFFRIFSIDLSNIMNFTIIFLCIQLILTQIWVWFYFDSYLPFLLFLCWIKIIDYINFYLSLKMFEVLFKHKMMNWFFILRDFSKTIPLLLCFLYLTKTNMNNFKLFLKYGHILKIFSFISCFLILNKYK